MATPDVNDLAQRILDGVKRRVGDAWQTALTAEERMLLADCAEDAAVVSLQGMVAQTPADQEAARREAAQVTAQLANIAATAAGETRDVFWAVVRDVVAGGLSIALMFV